MTTTWAEPRPPIPGQQYRPARPDDEVTARCARVSQALAVPGNPDAEILRGVEAALRWATNQLPAAPVSGRVMPSRHPVYLRAEQAAALDVVEGLRRVPDDQTIEFVGGVEHALRWVRGQADDDWPGEH